MPLLNRIKWPLWALFAALFAIGPAVGCQPKSTPPPTPDLAFEITFQVDTAGELQASLGVRNDADDTYPGSESFAGRMEVRTASGERAGELRAAADVFHLQPLEPGETVWPMSWQSQLEPGSYVLSWGAEPYGRVERRFTVD